MNWFERTFRRFSIINLTMYIIVGKVFCFLLMLFNSPIYHYLTLDAQAIVEQWQVWRLVTYMFIPQSNPFWFLIEIMLFYWIGTGLEQVWGSFRYTMYILGSVLGVAVAMPIAYALGWEGTAVTYMITGFFESTLFLPFAWYYGENELRLYLVFPVKVKFVAVIDAILIIAAFVNTSDYPWTWLILLFSMINMVIFFIVVLSRRGKQRTRLAGFHHKVAKAERQQKKTTVHRCTVCGITEKDDPNMTFRYCSKCHGEHEYCEVHLQDHVHVTNVVEFPKN